MKRRLLVAALATWPAMAVANPGSDFPYPAADDLSVRGFAQEVLYGTGTGRTPAFDDYTKGSYHVDPRELLERLPQEARIHKLQLRAAVVVGPFGPLWAYEVIALLKESSCTRVNRIVMPHARITFKASGCLPDADAAAWVSRLPGQVATIGGSVEERTGSCVLVADYTGGAPVFARAGFACFRSDSAGGFERLDELRLELGKRLVPTYCTYPPVPGQE